jgi:predicted N-acetyltransferase YhbS
MTLIETHDLAAAFMPAVSRQVVLDPIVVEDERPGDADARELLLDRAFGPARFRKTCQKLRAGRLPARGLSLVARFRDGIGGGEVVGTVRLWHVEAGGVAALMLGPLAVDSRYRCHGVGTRLMEEALERAAALNHAAVLLVGDAPYYAKFGFDRSYTLGLRMPGPVDDARFLGLELAPGALAMAKGLVRPTGALDLTRRRSSPRLRKAA